MEEYYEYQKFFWGYSNTEMAEFCFVHDGKVLGKIACDDESVVWNTACMLADNMEVSYKHLGHDLHQEKNKVLKTIDFIAVTSSYLGMVITRTKIGSLTAQKLEILGI